MEAFLLQNKVVTKKQLTILERKVEQKEYSFCDLLLKHHILSLNELQKVISYLFNIPFRSLDNFSYSFDLKHDLLSILNKDCCLNNHFVPLIKVQDNLIVGITSPDSLLFIHDLNDILSHYRIIPVVIPLHIFRNLFQKLFETKKSKTEPATVSREIGRSSLLYTMPHIIAFVGTKDDVGKKTIISNIAVSLAVDGKRVCILDGESGADELKSVTGIYPENDLLDIVRRKCNIEDTIIRNYHGVDIIAASRCVEHLMDLTVAESDILSKAFVSLWFYDYILVQSSLRRSEQMMAFCMASHEVVVVLTANSSCIKDSWNLIESFAVHGYKNGINLILNQAGSVQEARKVYNYLTKRLYRSRWLYPVTKWAGIIPFDKHVETAQIAKIPFVLLFPDNKVSSAIYNVSKRLLSHKSSYPIPFEIFWERSLEFFKSDSQ